MLTSLCLYLQLANNMMTSSSPKTLESLGSLGAARADLRRVKQVITREDHYNRAQINSDTFFQFIKFTFLTHIFFPN